MFSTSRALRSRSIVSKFEVERKFVPSLLLKKYACETVTTPHIDVTSATGHGSKVSLTRLPRKRITDKYFDHKGLLERKGIWVRWRKEEVTTPDGIHAISSHTSWEAKVKQGGNFLDSQFVEAEGRDAVEDLITGAGVCRSIYDLSFQLGVIADRIGWAVNGYDGEEVVDGSATMSLVLDTVSAALEGRNGECPIPMHQEVAELELETIVATNHLSEYERNHAPQTEAMHAKLTAFVSTYSTLFETASLPVGKITAYKQQKQELAARSKRANAINRLANMSEVRYERLARELKTVSGQ